MIKMGVLNYEAVEDRCPQHRKLFIIKEKFEDVFQEKVNKKLKELGDRMSNTKLHLMGAFFVLFIWYYDKKTPEEIDACRIKCGICGTPENHRRGNHIQGKWYCQECLLERLK
jgi:hypothetical protein